ncbi:MAG: LapA family protein [Acidimicrobiales bacterium]
MSETGSRAALDPAATTFPLESPPLAAGNIPVTIPWRKRTRLSSLYTGLIVAAVVLVVLLVFILQNVHSVNVRFLGAHARLPLSVALLLAAVGGALLIGTIGAARITQLRRAGTRHVRDDHQAAVER